MTTDEPGRGVDLKVSRAASADMVVEPLRATPAKSRHKYLVRSTTSAGRSMNSRSEANLAKVRVMPRSLDTVTTNFCLRIQTTTGRSRTESLRWDSP